MHKTLENLVTNTTFHNAFTYPITSSKTRHIHGCKYDVLREPGSPGRKRKVWIHAINGISLGFTRTFCFVMVFHHFVSSLPSLFSHSLRYSCTLCVPIHLLPAATFPCMHAKNSHFLSFYFQFSWTKEALAFSQYCLANVLFASFLLWECVCVCIVRSVKRNSRPKKE